MRVKFIDVLKAFAIIGVVFYHFGLLKFGYLGVDIFLVIAGYLTTRSLYHHILVPSNMMEKNIYISYIFGRIFRLLPLLLLVGSICIIIGYYTMLPDDYENLSQSIIATNLFGNNILAAVTTKNYWDVVNEYKPLMHTWYVGILMQFYVVYPLFFIIARHERSNPRRLLFGLLIFFAVLSFFFYYYTSSAAWRFYYLPSRFFEFAAGGITSLIIVPEKTHSWVKKWFIFLCYALLLALIIINIEIIPSKLKLVAVVVLSCMLLASHNILENSVTGNRYLAAIGAASYSIFVWHQVILAFCRYTLTSHFSYLSYLILLVVITIMSWISYNSIEQKTSIVLKSNGSKWKFYVTILFIFLTLNVFASYIYLNAGVVRDIPELYINKSDIHRGMHKIYNDKIYQYDRSFETNKRHWLVIGNSFGRDFSNVILESAIADSIELSYIYISNLDLPKYEDRYKSADRVFISSRGADESLVMRVDSLCRINKFPIERVVFVGTKSFGESNGQFYLKRGQKGYFDQRTKMEDGILESNTRMKLFCGDRYLDLIDLVIDENYTMPVFTPDHHFISQDCRHFSIGGAKYFATLIDWNKYFD